MSASVAALFAAVHRGEFCSADHYEPTVRDFIASGDIEEDFSTDAGVTTRSLALTEEGRARYFRIIEQELEQLTRKPGGYSEDYAAIVMGHSDAARTLVAMGAPEGDHDAIAEWARGELAL